MDIRITHVRLPRVFFVAALYIFFTAVFLAFPSCQGGKGKISQAVEVPRPTGQEAKNNPSPLLQALSRSPIEWQQFSPAVVQHARDSGKLLLIYVASNTQMDVVRVFNDIASDPQVVREINEQFVPVLVDVDSSREIGIFSVMLCSEINRSISFPFMLWISPAGDPITWLPMSADASRESTLSRIRQSQSVVIRMWNEDREYMFSNSANDSKGRKMRTQPAAVKPAGPAENQAFYLSTLRDLNALYDDLSGNIEGMGSLVPTSIQEYYAESAINPALSLSARKRCLTCIKGNAEMLIQSAAIDLIDGGSYSSRTDNAWHVTRPDRNGLMQAKVAFSFAQIAQVARDKAILHAAERVMLFHEKNFTTPDALFSLTSPATALSNEVRFWATDELEKILSAEEYALLKNYCDLSAIGNVPLESDPKREFFRRNSLIPHHSLEETTQRLGLSLDQGMARLDAIRAKLQPAREQKISVASPPLLVADAGATAQSVSAYAALFASTGQKEYQKKALATMAAFRANFHATAIMQNYAGTAPSATTDARAGLLATAIQSSLDLYEVTLAKEWIDYAMSLTNMLLKDHLVEGHLEESPPSSRLINLPIIDQSMVFDKSTTGLMKQSVSRLVNLGCEIPENLVAACQLDQEKVKQSAVIHTDYLLGLLYEEFPVIVTVPDDATPEMLMAVTRLPLRVICRKSVSGNGGKVTVALPGQPDQPVSDPAALLKLLTL